MGLAAIVAVVSLWPLGRLIVEALAPQGSLDLAVMRRVLDSPATWRAVWRTLDTSLWGTALSVVLGCAFALVVSLTDLRGKGVLVFAFMLPLMLPSQITALAWIGLLGPNSALLQALGIAPAPGSAHPLFGREGIILLFGVEHAPLVFLALRAGLRALPRELIEAARACGAGPWRAVLQVVMPIAGPSLAAGALLAFISSVGNFGTPALLGIPANYTTLTTLIYQRLAGFGTSVLAQVAALSLLIGALALAGVLLHSWVARRRDTRIIGVSQPVPPWRLGPARLAVEVAIWVAILALVVVPLVALVASSLVPAIGVPLSLHSFTVAAYGEAILRQAVTFRAFANSLLLAGAAALVLTLLAVPLARLIAWRPTRLARFLDLIVELPFALPGIVLAIACILVFIKPLPVIGVSIYGTLWIIFLAYLARFLALALRPLLGGLAQLDPALDEAAAAAGAGFARRLTSVLLPLLAPAAAASAALVFLTALNELTVSALLWSSGRETLGVIVYSLQEGGDTPLASAVSVIAIGIVVALMALADRLGRSLPPGALPWRG
ncbi:MAG: iron ABC transporter permease [Alphaproteobacteria bacterium]|nr:iron ABC transporter permease [Alphaproteobacteria bacterium]